MTQKISDRIKVGIINGLSQLQDVMIDSDEADNNSNIDYFSGNDSDASMTEEKYMSARVIPLKDGETIDVTIALDKKALQQLRCILEMQDADVEERDFNPASGPHGQKMVRELDLKEYSDQIAVAIEKLYRDRIIC